MLRLGSEMIFAIHHGVTLNGSLLIGRLHADYPGICRHDQRKNLELLVVHHSILFSNPGGVFFVTARAVPVVAYPFGSRELLAALWKHAFDDRLIVRRIQWRAADVDCFARLHSNPQQSNHDDAGQDKNQIHMAAHHAQPSSIAA